MVTLTAPRRTSHVPCAGFGLALASWLMFTVTFAVELSGCYTPTRSWLRRFPAVLICAGEIAKLR